MKSLSKLVFLSLLLLTGCVAPTTSIKTPMTARPVDREASLPHNGAIFQVGKNERPLFEDRRARNVGDILTINIVEAISSSQSSSNSSSHSGSSNISTPTVTYGTSSAQTSAKTILNPYGLSNTSAGSLADKSANAGANNFTGTITVTVVDVLPNGNLLIGGEKILANNKNNGYIRLSGVVDPSTIVSTATGFTVQSNQVADVHLEYKDTDNGLDQAHLITELGRAFLSMMPF